MKYRIRSTGEVVSCEELHRRYEAMIGVSVAFPLRPSAPFLDGLTDLAADPVHPGPERPTPGPLETLKELAPVLTEKGHWEERWMVVSRALTEEEAAELLERAKAKRKELATARRWEHETGGVAWNGLSIATDRDSRNIYGQTVQLVDKGLRPDGAKFKFADGGFRPLANEDVLPMTLAAVAHVQACFVREDALHQEIDAATDLAAVLAIDVEAGWPA